MFLDNLEYLTIKNQLTDFPMHYHETFCISLIHTGIERTDFNGRTIYGEAGNITITHPYEIHANPILDSDSKIGFDTIYISQDLMKYFIGGNVNFLQRIISDQEANLLFLALKKAIDRHEIVKIETLLKQFLDKIQAYSRLKKEDYRATHSDQFKNITHYIENNLMNKLNLDELAGIANLSKFDFARKFKKSSGMSPMNFYLMKKIFSAKACISNSCELTEIAYDYSFSDMAHFSNTFKRYVGISPKAYQKNLGLIL